MLSDKEIETAAADLVVFQQSDALSKILNNYAQLIHKYKRLKSDYEEERDAREKYKQLSKDSERNPFVLVLIDGDGYPFADHLLEKNTDGGGTAARLLNDRIKASMCLKGLENCQIMIRIYANVQGLSKALCKVGVVSGESRSLAPFIANFNRSYGLTEFIDAGQLKENTDFKIRALLKLYAENTQCKHIYFAGCHDVGYVSELRPFTGNSGKFTLVESTGILFHDEFRKLGMSIEELSGLFRTTPLQPSHSSKPHRPPTSPSVNGRPLSPASSATTTTGIGNFRKLAMSIEELSGLFSTTPLQFSHSSATTTTGVGNSKHQTCAVHATDKCESGNNCKDLRMDSHHSDPQLSLPTRNPGTPKNPGSSNLGIYFTTLPRKSEVPKGFVLINSNNHRLDPYIPPPHAEATARLKARVGKKRICHGFVLNGTCDMSGGCQYDHSALDAESLLALELFVRSHPCPRHGACRKEKCLQGHICQLPDCKHRGGKTFCRLPHHAHAEDLATIKLVPA